MAQRLGGLLRGLLPGVDAGLGVRREGRGFHGHRIGMRRDVVGQDQDRGLAGTDELTGHGEDEVGVGAIHVGQEGFDHRHGDFRPAGAERRAPADDVVLIELVRQFRAEAAGLRQHGGDDAFGRALQQVPDERAADAEAHHQEFVDAEMVHQAKLVIGIGIPRAVDLDRARGLAAVGVA